MKQPYEELEVDSIINTSLVFITTLQHYLYIHYSSTCNRIWVYQTHCKDLCVPILVSCRFVIHLGRLVGAILDRYVNLEKESYLVSKSDLAVTLAWLGTIKPMRKFHRNGRAIVLENKASVKSQQTSIQY